jgi:hypothetical protein
MRYVEKCGAGQTSDENMALVHGMLGTKDNKHTLRVCNA